MFFLFSYLDNLKHIFYLITVFVQRKKKEESSTDSKNEAKALQASFDQGLDFFGTKKIK